jgi:arylsulfatase A-like enzyme
VSRTTATAALLLLCVTLACEAPSARPAPRNLIVISVDTLRPDHLGCYGGQRPTSPHIDALASAGVLFEDALATSPWTLPSHGSLLTGLYPSRHGANAAKHAIPSSVLRLGGVLGDHGYHTSAIVNSVYLRKWGIEETFRELEYLPEAAAEREPSKITARAIRWLERRDRNQPFFLFLHYYDVHSDYASLPRYEARFVEPYDGRADGTTRTMLAHRYGEHQLERADAAHLARLYDAGIRQLDDQLGLLFESLSKQELRDETFIVFTSDHGEEFLEHGGVLHGLTQHREVLAIPLIITGPGVPTGTRIDEPVSLIDVMPTALSILELPVPDGLDGRPLDVLWQAESPGLEPRLLFTESDFTYDLETGVKALGPNRTARNKRFRLHLNIETREQKLFDLEADPWEQSDVLAQHPEVARLLLDHLERFMGAGTEPHAAPELSDADEQLLESLGYLQ